MILTEAQKETILACCKDSDYCYPVKNYTQARTLYALDRERLMKAVGPGFGYSNLYQLTEKGMDVRRELQK